MVFVPLNPSWISKSLVLVMIGLVFSCCKKLNVFVFEICFNYRRKSNTSCWQGLKNWYCCLNFGFSVLPVSFFLHTSSILGKQWKVRTKVSCYWCSYRPRIVLCCVRLLYNMECCLSKGDLSSVNQICGAYRATLYDVSNSRVRRYIFIKAWKSSPTLSNFESYLRCYISEKFVLCILDDFLYSYR